MLNSIYQAILQGDFLGKPFVNVYHFKQTSAGGLLNGSSELLSAIDSSYFPALVSISTTHVHYTSIDVANIDDLTDFASGSLVGNNGTVSGNPLPRSDCFTFRYFRATREFRNGYKRYPGVGEAVQDGGIIVDATELTNLAALAVILKTDLVSGLNTFQPGLLHRQENGLPVTPVFYHISDVQFSHVGTQNTRK